MSALLEARGLTRRFGGLVALDDVSFSVAHGEMVALIGPNGAGKSTCFNILMGDLKPGAGEVRLDGQRIDGLGARRVWARGVGRTFQITQSYPAMTVIENVQVALLARAGRSMALLPRARTLYRDEAMALLERVGLAEQAERPASVLAYGDLKRLELAGALAHAPRLLLMDEPTAGMGGAERQALMVLVAEAVAATGLAVLFTEHDMDVVWDHAARVLVLDRGRLIAEGPPEAIRADPEVRRVYLGGTI